MSFRGYKPKWKKAPWVSMRSVEKLKPVTRTTGRRKFPKFIRRQSKKRKSVNEQYREAAEKFVREAAKVGPCPVVTYANKAWYDCFAGDRKIDPLINSMHWLTQKKYGHRVSAKITEVHHACGRAGRLLLDQRWWLAVSKQGHRWIHQNPAFARELGWLCKAGHWNCYPEDLWKKGIDTLPPFCFIAGVTTEDITKLKP